MNILGLNLGQRNYQPGDWVVFRRVKHTTHPGQRAQNIAAAAHGDQYSYIVDKFWVVTAVEHDGRLRLQTRRGKTHLIEADDPNLRHASWWDRIRYRSRFAQLPSAAQAL